MANREIHFTLNPVVAMNFQTINSDTTTNGNIIDMQGYDSIQFYFYTGVVTDGDYTPLIQEGDESDLSDASAVADADLTVTEANAAHTDDTDDNQVSRIGYTGSKRYVRFNVVSANTSSGATSVGSIAVQGHAVDTAIIPDNPTNA